jgi:hypothetical protein
MLLREIRPMVYNEELEVDVFWVVKELGSPTLEDVSKR